MPASCRATEFLARHPGLTSLSINQPKGLDTCHQISFAPIEAVLPRLVTLVVVSDWECTSKRNHNRGLGGEHDCEAMRVDVTGISRLCCLTHLTLSHCSLGPHFNAVLDQLPLLVKCDLGDCEGVGALTVCGLSHLSQICVRHSDVTGLLISNCAALLSVAAEFSEYLSSVLTDACPSLAHLTINNCCSLPHLDVGSLPRLESVDASGCWALIKLVATSCPELRTLNAFWCNQLMCLTVADSCLLQSLVVGGQYLQELDYSMCISLTSLSVSDAALQSLGPCPTLRELTLHGCRELSTLDLSSFPQLHSARIGYCGALPSLRVDHHVHLKSLWIRGEAKLTALVVAHCPSLISAKIKSKYVDELSLTDLPSLLNIKVSSPSACYTTSRLHTDAAHVKVRIARCPAVLEVLVDHQGMFSLDLSAMPNLRRLDASSCILLSELHVSGCCSLDAVSLSNCQNLRHFDLASATHLRNVELLNCRDLLRLSPQLLDHSTVTSLHLTFAGPMVNFSNLVHLTNLHLDTCLDINAIPASSCPTVVSLEVTSCCELQHMDIAPLSALQRLRVEDCKGLARLGEMGPTGLSDSLEFYHNSGSVSRPVGCASPLQHLAIRSCPSLLSLDLKPYPLLKAVELLECKGLRGLELCHCPDLHTLLVNLSSHMTVLGVNLLAALKTIDLHGLVSLPRLDLSSCVNLQSLKLFECALSELDCSGCHSIQTVSMDNCLDVTAVTAVNLPELTTIRIRSSAQLTALHISGSHCLVEVSVGPESSLAFLDLTQAPNLAVTFHPPQSSALCPACMTCKCDPNQPGVSAGTYGFLHGTTVHRVCDDCAHGVSFRPFVTSRGNKGMCLSCPVCAKPCQLARFAAP